MIKAHTSLLDSLTILLSTLVQLIYTRLELLALDLEEDRQCWVRLLLLYLSAFVCFMLGVVFIAMLIVVAFWATHRLIVLGALAVFFMSIGLVLWVVAKRQAKPKLFLGSLLELLKDKQALKAK